MLRETSVAITLSFLALAIHDNEGEPNSRDGGAEQDSSYKYEMTWADAQRVSEEQFLKDCKQADWVLSADIGWNPREKKSAKNARLQHAKCLVGKCPSIEGRRILSLDLAEHVLSNFELACCITSTVYLARTHDSGLTVAFLWAPISEERVKRSCR